jgi:hypothetical protein
MSEPRGGVWDASQCALLLIDYQDSVLGHAAEQDVIAAGESVAVRYVVEATHKGNKASSALIRFHGPCTLKI